MLQDIMCIYEEASIDLPHAYDSHVRILPGEFDKLLVFKRALSRWESVIPVIFIETDDCGFIDIKIGFYSGDHGYGEPFNGVLGLSARSFSSENGKFHLDAAEMWGVVFDLEKSKVAHF